MKKFLFGCVALTLAAAPAFAQETDIEKTVADVVKAKATQTAESLKTAESTETAATAVEKIEVNEDGSLTGRVFAKVAGEETPVDAKVTLASEGVVIDAVQTENGSFSFANIAPGSYTLTGTTQGFAGGQTYDVAPYAGTGCTSCNLGLQSTSDVVYQDSPVYQGSSCGSCGSGGGGGGFGGGGGLGTRGRRLLTAGLIGGIIAVAVSDDDDEDASPDE